MFAGGPKIIVRAYATVRNITCSVNPILSTLGRLCDYEFRALAGVYNINCVHVSNSYREV